MDYASYKVACPQLKRKKERKKVRKIETKKKETRLDTQPLPVVDGWAR